MNDREFFTWKVVKGNERLLSFLKERVLTKKSIRFLKKAIEKGLCTVNGRVDRFASALLPPGATISLNKKWEDILQESVPEKFSVLYEDDAFFIVDKPSGIVSDQKEILKVFSYPYQPIHRLDKETSGVWMLAKTSKIFEAMKQQFSQKEVFKTYIALVDGVLKGEKKGKIETYFVKKTQYQGQTLWQSNPVQKKGFYALTYWEDLGNEEKVSLVLCHPVTGRTHQLRVHLLEMGHPVLGDYQYCKTFRYSSFVPRLLLHSLQIQFRHPQTGKMLCVQSLPPPYFFLNKQKLQQKLEKFLDSKKV